MKVALTIWGNRISPVFDSARKFLIAEVKDNKVVDRQYESINFEKASDIAQILNDFGIDVLICGAISRRFSTVVDLSKTRLIPFITGHVDVVLKSFIDNRKVKTEFFMPGCRNQQCRQGNGCNNFFNKKVREVNDMPGLDRTGPQGQGSMTGGARGNCNSANSSRGFGRRVSSGQNRRAGLGRGKGQGFGRNIEAGEFNTADEKLGLLKAEVELLNKKIVDIEKKL